jgi:hypothetical protein
MEITLLFLGVVVSAVVQFLKTKFNLDTLTTVFVVVGMSLLGALAMWGVEYFGWREAFLQILMTAGAFYAFIIRNIEKTLER